MLWKIILLGIIQGLTEFLPVSSTAHLVLAEKLLGVSETNFGLAFDVSLHLGTTLALLVFFREFWFKIIFTWKESLRNTLQVAGRTPERWNGEKKIFRNLLLATVPAVLMGLFFQKEIEKIFRSPFWIAIFLILFSLVFYLAEIVSKKSKEIKQMKIIDALIIGVNQAIALLPGVSRSGITISGGLLLNFKREEAGKFAFLLSTPIIIGAFIKEHGKDLINLNFFNGNLYFLVGAIISFLVGLLTLKYFLKYLNKGSLMPFIVYRIILGIIILSLVIK